MLVGAGYGAFYQLVGKLTNPSYASTFYIG
jgi:hypothetical protein